MNNDKADVRLEDVEGTKAELDRKARKMLEDKDADSRMRIYDGPLGKAIVVLLCLWTAFQLYFTTIGAISAINLRAIHCIFLLVFTFLLFPTYKKEKRRRKVPPLWDWFFILGSAGSFLYLISTIPALPRREDVSAVWKSALPWWPWCASLRRPEGRREIWPFWQPFSWLITGSAPTCRDTWDTTVLR